MQTVNFNCPFCGKLMAVGINLLGRNVRCPHCKQVVQAPAAAAPPPPAPVPARTAAEPSFNLPAAPQESHESIFGEVHDDDVFGTRQPKVQMPIEMSVPPNPSADETANTERMSSAPVAVTYPDTNAPTVSAAPASDFATPNPWAAPAPPSNRTAPAHQGGFAPDTGSRDELPSPARPSPRAGARETGGGALVWILLLYGLAVTGVAAYLFFTRTAGGDANPNHSAQQHPYLVIPDFFGEYERVQRRKIARIEGMPPANLPLPKDLQVALGDTLVIGDLEVKPVKIEWREARRFSKEVGRAKFEPKPIEKPVYLLHLHIKNTSDDLIIHPSDPAFNSKYFPDTKVTPYAGVVVGDKRFLGGPLVWPDPQYERQYIEGQENDDKPLGPKEERDYVICSVQNAADIRDAMAAAKDTPAVWRVQLRRGLMAVKDAHGKDHEISVTSVIGVVFNAADVQ